MEYLRVDCVAVLHLLWYDLAVGAAKKLDEEHDVLGGLASAPHIRCDVLDQEEVVIFALLVTFSCIVKANRRLLCGLLTFVRCRARCVGLVRVRVLGDPLGAKLGHLEPDVFELPDVRLVQIRDHSLHRWRRSHARRV